MVSSNIVGCLEGHDIEEYNQIVAPWDVNLCQTSSGQFHGRMEYLQVNGIIVYREHWSQSVLATGATPPGYFMFGNTLQPEKRTDWCGQVIGPEIFACGNPGSETHFVTPKDSRHLVILIPDHLMRSYFGKEAIEAILANQRHHLDGIRQGASTLIPGMNRMLDSYQKRPELLSDVQECQAIESQLLAEVAKIFPPDTGEAHRPGPQTRREAYRRAIELGDGLKKRVTVPEFAALTGVSQRTLELAFQEAAGITPQKYLRWRRMHMAHHDLLAQDPKYTRITDVTTSLGFTELGRFAVEYKRLFGESPSETLRNRRPATPRRLIDVLTSS